MPYGITQCSTAAFLKKQDNFDFATLSNMNSLNPPQK